MAYFRKVRAKELAKRSKTRARRAKQMRTVIPSSQWVKFGDKFKMRYPVEFNRTPGNFAHWSIFKATEVRTFRLYGSEIALEEMLPPDELDLWRMFTCGTRILSDVRFAQVNVSGFYDCIFLQQYYFRMLPSI